jgi:hypothetical protein
MSVTNFIKCTLPWSSIGDNGNRVRVMVFNATFNNILVISWWSVLLVEETSEGFELITFVVIGTDCIGSCKSNHHTIMTTTAPVAVSNDCIGRCKSIWSQPGWPLKCSRIKWQTVTYVHTLFVDWRKSRLRTRRSLYKLWEEFITTYTKNTICSRRKVGFNRGTSNRWDKEPGLMATKLLNTCMTVLIICPNYPIKIQNCPNHPIKIQNCSIHPIKIQNCPSQWINIQNWQIHPIKIQNCPIHPIKMQNSKLSNSFNQNAELYNSSNQNTELLNSSNQNTEFLNSSNQNTWFSFQM